MTKYTIDPRKEARLQKFLAGKGVRRSKEVATLDLSKVEAASLLRKGFKAYVKPAASSESSEEASEPEPEPKEEQKAPEQEPDPESGSEPEDTPKPRRRSSAKSGGKK